VIGLVAMTVVSFIDYKVFVKFSPVLLLIVFIFLIMVLMPGMGVKALGAKRWLNFGFFVLQPTELAKLALILYAAAFLHKKKNSYWSYLVLLTFMMGLIMLEPDLGTTVIIAAIGLIVYFVAGAPLWQLMAIGFLDLIGGILAIVTSPYRQSRLTTLFDHQADPLGASYHIRQALIAIGSGGFWGLGLGQSRQKFEYLPEATTDSIFAIIAEELGFLGGLALIVLFFVIILRIFKIAKTCADRRGMILTIGIGSWIGIQAMINFGAMVALFPLTGVPLPFVSYGGSSLIINLVAMGMILNVSKHKITKK